MLHLSRHYDTTSYKYGLYSKEAYRYTNNFVPLLYYYHNATNAAVWTGDVPHHRGLHLQRNIYCRALGKMDGAQYPYLLQGQMELVSDKQKKPYSSCRALVEHSA